MGADGDWSFENWKRHGGDTSTAFDDDPKSAWDFYTWRFGGRIQERRELEAKMTEVDAKLAELQHQYRMLLMQVRHTGA